MRTVAMCTLIAINALVCVLSAAWYLASGNVALLIACFAAAVLADSLLRAVR